jgi:4a-hydroxytetrahydrobiopterin dehydratase
MTNLLTKHCKPCEGGVPPLTDVQIKKLLLKVCGWHVRPEKKIFKEFKFKNFKIAMEFVNKVADIAEEENHHPDIILYNWNKVRIELYTHAISGLSENDFIVAAKIDEAI